VFYFFSTSLMPDYCSVFTVVTFIRGWIMRIGAHGMEGGRDGQVHGVELPDPWVGHGMGTSVV
jgi:hypothetical protein